MALSVQSLDAPYSSTQRYLVTATVGDTITATLTDIGIGLVTVSPISATMRAGGITFAATQLGTTGGAAPLLFTDTTDGETISVTVNMTGPIIVTPNPITGQVGQTVTVNVGEYNLADAFASFTIEDGTIASLSVTSNAEGNAVLAVALLLNGSTLLDIDDGHGGTLSVPIFVGPTGIVPNVTIAPIEAVIGGQLVKAGQTVIPLQDSTSGYNQTGGYTISLTSNAKFAVTFGKRPAESTTQINVLGAVVRANGQVFLADLRTQQVTTQAVNSTIMAAPGTDGSYLSDGVVSTRSLGADVLALFDTVTSGTSEPTNPHQGQQFFNTSTNVFEVYENGVWVTIASIGASSTLAGLADVTLSSLTDGQVLTYAVGAGKWENKSPAKSLQLVLCAGDITPSATGADAVTLEAPYDPVTGASVAWTAADLVFRVETTASSGTTSVKIQRSTGSGVFSNTGYLNTTSLDIASGSYESTTTTFATSSLNSGDKLRCEFTAIGTGAAGFGCYLTLKG